MKTNCRILALAFVTGVLVNSMGQSINDSQRWISIGPHPIPNMPGWGTVSGRVRAVAVDPANASHWLIGAASGGAWDTRDAGVHWQPRTDDQASLAMGAIAFAPGNPNIVYAGTGEEAVSEGAGVLKSTDGGIHWQLLAPDTFVHTACTVIKVDPSNPNTLLAGTTPGTILPVVDGGIDISKTFLPIAPPTGIERSVDGGLTWSLTLAGQASDLAVDPVSFARQYAALGGIFGTITNGPLASTNGLYRSLDGGETWTPVDGPWSSPAQPVGRVQLAIAPSNPDVLFVSMGVAFGPGEGLSPEPHVAGTSLGLWRTTNAWAATPTWTQLPDPGDVGDQLWYDHVLSVDPANPSVLFFGAEALMKFTGSAWQSLPSVIHSDEQCLAWAGNRLIVGNDGGVYSTLDRGNTWNNHNGDLAITQFYSGALHPSNPSSILAGCQDIGWLQWTGASAWTFLVGGDGIGAVLSPSRPDTHIAAVAPYGDIFRCLNGPGSYVEEINGLDLSAAPGICRLVMHPNREDLLLFGTDRVWKCTNFFSAATPSWYANSPARSGMGSNRGSVSALAFAPSDPSGNTYAYGNRYGDLWLTTDGGTTWRNLDPNHTVPDRFVSALVFDSTDPNALYLTLGEYEAATPGQGGYCFHTTNALATTPYWANISPPVSLPHFCIALDPEVPGILYVGTAQGVWQSRDGGVSWRHLGPERGLPNAAVSDLQFQRNTGRVFAFTYGRGAFVLLTPPVLSPPQTLADGTTQVLVQVHSNERCSFEASTNLQNWSLVSTFTATNSTTSVRDQSAYPGSQRFYRARLLFP